MSDIESMIESLSAEDIKHLMASINKQKVNKVDTSYRLRRNNITSLYFSCEPAIYKFPDFKEYNRHADAIREQVITGVDL